MAEIPLIAVIDDDPSMRVAIANLLRALDYAVEVHVSAETFLPSAGLARAWCVITDVRMPGMSGIELQSRLRTAGSDVPFIFITAVAEDADRARALRDGAMCFLAKPVDEDVLVRCLATVIGRRRRED